MSRNEKGSTMTARTRRSPLHLLLALALSLLAAAATACSDSNSTPTSDSGTTSNPDGGLGGGDGGTIPDAGCYAGPINDSTPYTDIINACTSAKGIAKTPKLPTYADGGLPPLGTNPLPPPH